MLRLYPPAELRALEAFLQPRVRGKHHLTDWHTSIAGPFCFWPQRSHRVTMDRATSLANALSARLRLHVCASTKRNEVNVLVCLTEAERDRLIQDVYGEETEG